MSSGLPAQTVEVLQQVLASKRANAAADEKGAASNPYGSSPGANEGGTPVNRNSTLNEAELHLITRVVSQVLSQSNLAGLLGGPGQEEASSVSTDTPATPATAAQQRIQPSSSNNSLQAAAAAAAARAIAALQQTPLGGAPSSPLQPAPPPSPATPAVEAAAVKVGPGSPAALAAPPSSPVTPAGSAGHAGHAQQQAGSGARHRLAAASPSVVPRGAGGTPAVAAAAPVLPVGLLDPNGVLAKYSRGEYQQGTPEQLQELWAAEHALEEELQQLNSQGGRPTSKPAPAVKKSVEAAGRGAGAAAALQDTGLEELLDALAAAAPGEDLVELLGEELAAALGIPTNSGRDGSSGGGAGEAAGLLSSSEQQQVNCDGSPSKGGYPVYQQPSKGSYATRMHNTASSQGSTGADDSRNQRWMKPQAAQDAARANLEQWQAEGGFMLRGRPDSPESTGRGPRERPERPASKGKGKGPEAPRRLSQFDQEQEWQKGLRVYADGRHSPVGHHGVEAITPRTEARFEQLYRRAMEWQQRKEHLRQVVRAEREAAAATACTFTPAINKSTKAILQRGVRYPPPRIQPDVALSVTSTLVRPGSAWSSGRTHTTARPNSPNRPGSAAGRLESDQALTEVDQTKAHIKQAVINALGEEEAGPVLQMLFGGENDAAQAPAGNGRKTPAVCKRLYEQAKVWEERRQQRAALTAELERAARSFSAPRSARNVSPRVYDWYTAANSSSERRKTLPTGMDECTFYPRTNSRGRSRSRTPGTNSFSPFSSNSSPANTTPNTTPHAPGAGAANGSRPRDKSPLGQQKQSSSWLSGLHLDAGEAAEQLHALHAAGLLSTEELQEALAAEAAQQAQQVRSSMQQQQQSGTDTGKKSMKQLMLSSHRLDAPHQVQEQSTMLSPGDSLTDLVQEATRSAAIAVAASQFQRSAGPLRRAGSPAGAAGSQQGSRPRSASPPFYPPSSIPNTQQGVGSTPRSSSGPRQRRQVPFVPPQEDLDWAEFIERQENFLMNRSEKLALMRQRSAATPPEKPKLSPGSARILRQRQAAAAAADAQGSPCSSGTPGSAGSAGSPFLEKMQQQLRAYSTDGQRSPCAVSPSHRHYAHNDYSFRPAITKLGARQKPRTLDDMSEGERLRREAKREAQRLQAQARELQGATFTPSLSPESKAGAYSHVKPRLDLRQPELYMARLEEERRRAELLRQQARLQRMAAELKECTFQPTTTPVPAYLQDLADVGYTARFIESRLADALAMRAAAQQPGSSSR